MFILEEPYVSGLLRETVLRHDLPVLDTPMAARTLAGQGRTLISGDEAAIRCQGPSTPRVYANSENALHWVDAHLDGTDLQARIRTLKDKVRFRRLLADLYPDYQFQEVALDGLDAFDPTTLRTPFVVKPAVGFFSLGVHVVGTPGEWPEVAGTLRREAAAQGHLYPGHVLEFGRFIAEESIPGEEFAVDAYYDSEGRVVILDILGHLFASPEDVSDRVYHTSPDLIRRWRLPFAAFLEDLGRRAGLRDFPIHAELRVDAGGRIAPIEVNPLRFAGWCVTDLAHHAYGINPYEAFLLNRPPDWDRILEAHPGTTFAVVVADLPASVDLARIASVDLDAFRARFSRPLELRPVDARRYPVFAFLFVEAEGPDDPELQSILGADLTVHLRLEPQGAPGPHST